MKAHRLPKTDSIEELARFWDTHDLTDFEGDLVEVTEPVFDRETAITLRLQPTEAEAVRDMAKSKGLADAELIRAWVLERIHGSWVPEFFQIALAGQPAQADLGRHGALASSHVVESGPGSLA